MIISKNKTQTRSSVVGFVRYSQTITFGQNTQARNVFEPEYFEYRYRIFTEITLRSFQAQTDPDFVLLLLHSVSMPKQYRDRFEALEKQNPFLHNIFVENDAASFRAAVKSSIDFVSFQNGVAVTFRIDNDDALQNNFIETLRFYNKMDFAGSALSMPTVSIIKRVGDQSYLLEERDYPSNSIGLAYVCSEETFQTVLEVAEHDRMNENHPLILLPQSTSGGLMTVNGENAVNSIQKNRAKIFDIDELSLYLKKRKINNFDFTCLRVFEDHVEPSRFSLQKAAGLLLPPLITKVMQKLKYKLTDDGTV